MLKRCEVDIGIDSGAADADIDANPDASDFLPLIIFGFAED